MKAALVTLFIASSSLLFSSEFSIKLIETAAIAKLPNSLPYQVLPSGNNPSRITFLIEGKNIVAFEEDSLKTNDEKAKWKGAFFNSISEDGKYASLQLESETVLLGKMDSYQLKGTVEIITGSETETKNLKLTNGAEATEVGPLKIKFKKGKKGKKQSFFSSPTSIQIAGSYEAIKEMCILIDGKEIQSNSWSSSSNGPRSYSFENEIKGKEVEVKITYWTDLKKSTIAFEK